MKKVLNQNALKYILIVAMTIAHIAWTFDFFSDYEAVKFFMGFIGMLTAPTMSMFIAEGYYYTRSKRAYGFRLLIFAVITHLAAVMFCFLGDLKAIDLLMPNMIFNLFFSFCALAAFEGFADKKKKIIVTAALVLLCAVSEWSVFVVLWAFAFYKFKNNTRKKYTAYYIIATICSIYGFISGTPFQVGVLIAPLLLIFYNGKKGSNHPFHKWFFYIYFPLHFIVLELLKLYVVK